MTGPTITNNAKNSPAASRTAPPADPSNPTEQLEGAWLFAPPVQEAYFKLANRKVYWLNGSGEEHNIFLKLAGSEATRQQAFEKAVYQLACNEQGEPLFRGKILATDLHLKINRSWARGYGLLILGLDDEDEEKPDILKGTFEGEAQEELKK